MAARIHPTAIIETGATIGAEVEIGAYAFVGAGVTLGEGTRLHHHASVEGNTILGSNCQVYPYACIGGLTQDLKFKGGNPGVRIGSRNVFREHACMNRATEGSRPESTIPPKVKPDGQPPRISRRTPAINPAVLCAAGRRGVGGGGGVAAGCA